MRTAYNVGQSIIDLVTEVATQYLEGQNAGVVKLVEGLATSEVNKAIDEASPNLKDLAGDAIREAIRDIDFCEVMADNVDWEDMVKACMGESSLKAHFKKAAESAVNSEIDDCDFEMIVKDGCDLHAIATASVDEALRDRVSLEALAEVLVRTDAFWAYVTGGMDYHKIGKILDAKVNSRFDDLQSELKACRDQLVALQESHNVAVADFNTPWWVKLGKVVRSWIS